MRVEAPEDVDDTIVWYADGRTTFVQAKERLDVGDAVWDALWQAFAMQYRSDAFVVGKDRLSLHISESVTDHIAVGELCDRARTYETSEAWLQSLSKVQRKLVNKVAPLLAPILTVSEDVLHEFFGHVEVQLWPRTQIESDWLPYWMPHASVEPHTLFRLLRDRVGGEARHRGTFTASQLRCDLQDNDRVAFRAAPDMEVLRADVRACGALLRLHKATLGKTGAHVIRSVVNEIADWALEAGREGRVGLLLDHAGRGKTVVMRDVLLALDERGVTVLAIKADQQLSGVQDATALYQRLRLPEPVEGVVGRLVAQGPVVVIVDQLDALSLSLARDQRGLNTVLEMVGRLRSLPGVTILLSCRTFDRKIDPRLSRLEVGREFAVPLLDDGEVATVLTAVGIDPLALSPATIQLLRTPLHLDLFASLAAAPHHDAARLRGMQSLQDLYGLLWHEVVMHPGLPGSSPQTRERVLQVMTARMHQDQRISVQRALLATMTEPDAGPAVDALASAGLLVETSLEWTFLHQSFFDYCYARFFVEEGRELATTVLSSDQGLFTRPQIVQVLAYLRGNDIPGYVRALEDLLAASTLRFHLRDLVLRWVGSLANPTDAEWRLMYRRLLDPALRMHTMLSMAGNSAWFTRLSGGALEGLLRGDAAFVDEGVVPFLASIADTDAQGRIADLIRPWLDREDPFPTRAQYVVQRVRLWRTPSAIALFEEVVARKPLTQIRQLFELDDVAEADPIAGCRLIRALLDRILDAHRSEPATYERSLRGLASRLEVLNGSAAQKAIEGLSKTAPSAFLDAMLPWLESAVTVDDELGLGRKDHVYGSDSVTTAIFNDGRVIRNVLLQAYVSALVALARADGDAFERMVWRLDALPYTTPHLILTNVYRELPPDRASDALGYVLGDARRLRLGKNDAYESRMLLRAIAPHLSTDQLGALERFILGSTGDVRRWSDLLAGLRWRGLDQLLLLRELSGERMSSLGRARLAELERKFPNFTATDSSRTTHVGWVGPPIPADACARMSDTAWLGAIRKYAHGVEHEDFLKGGAAQLARVFKEQVKLDPARFARLAERLPDDIDDKYVEALMEGLAESGSPTEWLFALVRRFVSHGRPELHQSAAWVLSKVVGRAGGLPADLLLLLEGWVRGAKDEHESFYENHPQDLYNGAFNTPRGSAFRTLMYALGQDESDDALVRRWALAEFVARDTSSVLRAGGLDALKHLLYADANRAISVFEETVHGHPRLRSTAPFEDFLYHASFGHFVRIGPHIRELMNAESHDARQRGAELAVLGLLSDAGLEDDAARVLAQQLAEEAISGPPEWRQGVAHIYAHNWADHPASHCESGLRLLSEDPELDVRRQVAWLTHKLRPEHALTRQDFLLSFAASRAVHSDIHDFAEYLWEHGMLDPAWALHVVEALLRNGQTDDEYGRFGGGESLVRLVLRVYTDPGANEAVRSQAIDLFDLLMDRFAGYAMVALADWDRG